MEKRLRVDPSVKETVEAPFGWKRRMEQESFIKTLNITQEKILKDWKALIETVKETERLYASIKWTNDNNHD